MNKRKVAIIGAVVLMAALISGGTWAVFTGQGRATNVITTGTVDIVLNDAIEGGRQTSAGWTMDKVMPGSTVGKKVSVTNKGTGDAWIRVKTDTAVTEPREGASRSSDSVIINYNTGGQGAHWFDGGDGWYYYSVPLKGASLSSGETTPDLFSTVTLDKNMPDSCQNCTVTIDVLAQAVQAKNNGDELKEMTRDKLGSIQGWPEAE